MNNKTQSNREFLKGTYYVDVQWPPGAGSWRKVQIMGVEDDYVVYDATNAGGDVGQRRRAPNGSWRLVEPKAPVVIYYDDIKPHSNECGAGEFAEPDQFGNLTCKFHDTDRFNYVPDILR